MGPLIRLPACAALGLSFTGCDPRRLPDDSETAGLDGGADEDADPLAGTWRLVVVERYYDLFTQTSEYEMTIDEDLDATFTTSIFYDAPGTKDDEHYAYDYDLAVQALGSARYRIALTEPKEPDRPGTVWTCMHTNNLLTCDPDDPYLDDVTFERE